MANAVPADASSSASVNPTLITVEYTSSETIKLILSGDVSIVSRLCYFDEPLAIEELPLPLTETQTENLYQASRRFLAEKQAAVYLNRAEHSSYQLTVKLQKKGYIKNEYQPALDYLRAEGTLDDSRFAGAYLHTRSLSKKEGYARLFSELRKRGIAADTARQALNDFFAEIDEAELCAGAVRSLIRKGYTDQKLYSALQRKGFPFSMIKRCIVRLSSAAS